jgi:deoxycytidine triphosphate deaminase
MVLNDTEILQLLVKGLIPTGLKLPADPYEKDSPVQPSSLDLSVGGVYLPCTKDQNKDVPPVGLEQYILEPGRTAIVLTKEEIKMPPGIVALGFPPSKVSVQGILMTNPGQVDPGYEGPLRFTVINMGSKDFVLDKGKPIVSLVFIRLTSDCTRDWLTRHSGEKGGPITWGNLNQVSSDFVNVEARASKIAMEAVNQANVRMQAADLRIKKLQIWVPVLAGILTLVLSYVSSLLQSSWKEPLQKVQQDVAVLQSQKSFDQLSNRIKNLEDELKALKEAKQNGFHPPHN